MEKEQIMVEREYFNATEKLIENKLNKLTDEKIGLRKEVIEAREDMFKLCPSAISNFADVIALCSQNSEVDSKERMYDSNEAEIRKLTRMQQSPYFGRLDFENTSTGRKNTVYIGIYSLRNDETFKLQIIDWRAPAASLYYNYDLGEGSFEVSGRENNVNITLKRQYKIENGELIHLYDTNSSMYDEILGGILSQNTEHKLKVIAGSIQKEQNAAIRSDAKRSCLIYGLAGSGKTSVGLHRLAYILYHNRDKLKAHNILVISNNSIFSSYISTILPDLGEEPVKSFIFHDLLFSASDDNYRIEEYYEQLRITENHLDAERSKNIKLKYSVDFLEFIIRHFASFKFKIPEIRYKDKLILNESIFKMKWGTRSFSSFKASCDMAKELIKNAVEDYFTLYRESIIHDIERESDVFLTSREVASIYKREKQEYITNAIHSFEEMNELNPEDQLSLLIRLYLDKIGENTSESEKLAMRFVYGKLYYEDALLYLFVKILMGHIKSESFSGIRHIVIDEIQDYNPLQLYIMKYLFPKCSFTLLGDIYQAVNSDTAIQSYDIFTRIFGSELMKIKLDKCYRSSSDINALAFKLTGFEKQEEYSYFERKVKKPKYIVTHEPYSEIDKLLYELHHYNAIAIITNTDTEAKKVKAALKGHTDAQLIISPEDNIRNKLVIMPLLLSKGLEFDAVILLNSFSDNKNDENFRRRVYLGATRALHELYFIERDALPEKAADIAPLLEI